MRARTLSLATIMVHGKMFADVAQKIEETDRRGPGGVVQQARGIGLGVEIEQAAQLFLHAGDVVRPRTSRVSNWRSAVLPLGSPMEPVAPPATAMG